MSFTVSNIGKALYTLLNSTVSMFPSVAPQDQSGTYAVYDIVRIDPDDVKQDTSWVDTVTVIITIHASAYNLCQTKGLAVRTIIDDYSGTSSGVAIESCHFVNETDDFDEELNKYIKIAEYVMRILNT